MIEGNIEKPLMNRQCPLCGGDNACAPASAGSFNVECWCNSVSFSSSVLDRVPEQFRRNACICKSCAEEGQAGQAD